MKALVLQEYKKFAIEELEVPPARAGELLIRVRACGICGSDVHGMDGSTGRRIPPLVMGHEAAGEVAAVGPSVTGWKVGDRVTFDSTIYCGECWYCKRGEVNLCDNRQVLGVSCGDYRRQGAFAEFVAVPQRVVYRLPDNLTFEQAAMVEAVAVAVHAVDRTPLPADAAAVVVGVGMIGQLVVQALRVAKCKQIIAVDLDDDKLQRARGCGATSLFKADTADLAAQVRALTNGRGADAAFEVVGLTPSLKTAVDCVRKGGSVTLVGNLKSQVELPLQLAVTRQLTLIGSCASSGEYPKCLSLIAKGEIDVTAFISATPPLVEGASWFARLYAGEKGLMKVLLKP